MSKVFFVLIHAGCLLAIWSGVSAVAVLVCLALYAVRMFAITAGYHRLLSHRSYKTSRVFQFILAALGAAAAQKGPLRWAASHRYHHHHAGYQQGHSLACDPGYLVGSCRLGVVPGLRSGRP